MLRQDSRTVVTDRYFQHVARSSRSRQNEALVIDLFHCVQSIDEEVENDLAEAYPIGSYLCCSSLKLKLKTHATRPYLTRYQNCQSAHDLVHFEHFQFEGLSAGHHP